MTVAFFHTRWKYPSSRHLLMSTRNSSGALPTACAQMSAVRPSDPGVLLESKDLTALWSSFSVKGGSQWLPASFSVISALFLIFLCSISVRQSYIFCMYTVCNDISIYYIHVVYTCMCMWQYLSGSCWFIFRPQYNWNTLVFNATVVQNLTAWILYI